MDIDGGSLAGRRSRTFTAAPVADCVPLRDGLIGRGFAITAAGGRRIGALIVAGARPWWLLVHVDSLRVGECPAPPTGR